jgi:hypothetical protein
MEWGATVIFCLARNFENGFQFGNLEESQVLSIQFSLAMGPLAALKVALIFQRRWFWPRGQARSKEFPA